MKRLFIAILFPIIMITVSFASVKTVKGFAAQDSIRNKSLKTDTTKLIIPEGLTAKNIIDNYIKAIGGEDNIQKVYDRATVMKSKINDKNLTITIYQKLPDEMRQIVDFGTFKQNIYYIGTKGVMVVGGKTLDVQGSELEKLKYESMLHFLVNLDSLGIKLQLDGASQVNGKEAYKVKMILPSGAKWIQYFDSKSWFKVKETKEIIVAQGTFVQDSYYSDYREVDGLKYPFSVKQDIGTQHVDSEVESIKVNNGLNDKLFKEN